MKLYKGLLTAAFLLAAGMVFSVSAGAKDNLSEDLKTDILMDDMQTISPDDWGDCSPVNQTYQITSDYKEGIALHTQPNKDSVTLTRIPQGDTFLVTSVYQNYGYTYYGGFDGWINLDYAAVIDQNTGSDAPVPTAAGQLYEITSSYEYGIALHPEPDKDSEVLIRIPKGATFLVTSYDGNYGYTSYQGFSGWINLDYAKMIESTPQQTAPVQNPVIQIPAQQPAVQPQLPQQNGDSPEPPPAEETQTETSSDSSNYQILPNSDSTYLTRGDLNGLSGKEACYARNEIYARHGGSFQTQELNDYFSGMSWYKPIYPPGKFPKSLLNDYEVANIQVLLAMEIEFYPHGYFNEFTDNDRSFREDRSRR
ncbi:MAG: YARHG domain-containing protein [Lachnospiraceae bacterium]|nr:YARHG domain-containing protein [Lachnospiraceae bacterium]